MQTLYVNNVSFRSQCAGKGRNIRSKVMFFSEIIEDRNTEHENGYKSSKSESTQSYLCANTKTVILPLITFTDLYLISRQCLDDPVKCIFLVYVRHTLHWTA